MEEEKQIQVYREQAQTSPFASMMLFFLGLTLLISFVAALIVSWHNFTQEAPLIVRVLLIALAVVICGTLCGVGLYRGYMAWLRVQHAREELAAMKDEHRRRNEMHSLHQHLALTRLPADQLGNYPYLINEQMVVYLPPGNPAFAPARTKIEGQAAPLQLAQGAPNVVTPTIEALIAQLPYNRLMTAYGVMLTSGKVITASIPEAVHFKIVGSSGFGKSCEAAALLKIATSCNDANHLQIALLDLERKTSRLFEALPHVATIKAGRKSIDMAMNGPSADEVAHKLAALKMELDRRAAHGIETPLLLIYVEEMLSLQYEVDETLLGKMLDHLAILAVRGRKYGMFLEACTQVDYSTEELRAAQKQFRTRIGFALDPSAARASGFINTVLIKQNFQTGRPGQFVLEMPGFSQLMLAPAYDVKTELARLEAPTSHRSSATSAVWEAGPSTQPNLHLVEMDGTPARKWPEAAFDDETEVSESPPLSAKALQVAEMLRQRKGQNEIIESLWGVTGGRAYQEAVQEYREIVALLLERSA